MGRLLLAALLGALGWLAATAAPAAAHAELVSSVPAAGSALAQPPVQVVLTFSETPSDRTVVAVRDGCDRPVTGQPRRDGSTVVVPVTGGTAGTWTVSVSVLSDEDGHTSSTDLSFTVDGSPRCGPSPEPVAPGASPAPAATAAAATPTASPAGAPAVTVGGRGDGPALGPLLALAGAVGALTVVVGVVRRRTRS